MLRQQKKEKKHVAEKMSSCSSHGHLPTPTDTVVGCGVGFLHVGSGM